MNVFETVKQSVTVREAAEMYGIEVKRNGMACCPFHDDKNPSMKLNEEYFYCFGCGATGDVIDFAARLYNLSPKEAAEKLAQDFGLTYDSQAPPKRHYVRQKTEAQKFKEDREHSWRVLADYYHLLQKWETNYSPKTPEENPHPRFMEAVQRKDYVGYLLDFFLEDSPEEQKLWIAEHQSEIADLERRVKFMADKPTNRERLQEITAGIEQGIKELFESEKYMRYLSVMSKFHRYSVNNTMLIYMQRPDATLVAGFNKWKNQFERHVKKGEHGITIIAPTPYKKKIEEMKRDPDTQAPILDADGKAVMEEKEIEIPMFRPVKVFDVSQTDGKPLPELASSLSGTVPHYEAFLEALRRSAPVPIEFEPMAESMDGYFSSEQQRIAIREGMSEVQTISAAVHEIAHSKLHDPKKYEVQESWKIVMDGGGGPLRDFYSGFATEAEAEQFADEMGWRYLDENQFEWRLYVEEDDYELLRAAKNRNTEEVEAESVSYAVCQYFGIETGESSFGYIATWSKGKELDELKASLETINKTSGELIDHIERNYKEICKERGIDLTAAPEPEQPAPAEPVVEYRVLPNQHSVNELDRSVIQAYTVQGKNEIPGDVLGAGRTEKCTELAGQLNSGDVHAAQVKEQLAAELGRWHCYIIPDIMTWNSAAGSDKPRTPIEFYDSYEQALARFRELRPQEYNSEIAINPQTDTPFPRLTFGIQREQPPSAADLLHVRQGQNYLVDDFTRMDALNQSPEVMEVLRRMNEDLGFDRVRLFQKDEQGNYHNDPVDMAFNLWENPYFPDHSTTEQPEQAAEPGASAQLPDAQEQALDEYPMPDPALTQDDLEKCGYLDGDLLPLSKERAYELMERDLTVYIVQQGENPEMAFDTADLDAHDGIFAVSREEWEESPEFAALVKDRMNHQEEREQAFLSHKGDCFAIYQVKHTDELRDIRYEGLEWLQSIGRTVQRDNYELVYTAPLQPSDLKGDTTEQLFYRFNNEHPADYQHPSMSVSDIVAIKRDGKVSCHYCDSFGFEQIPGFLPDNPLKNAEMTLEDDYGMIDGIINNGPKEPTVAQLEQQARSGQPISLMDLAAAAHREDREKKKSVMEQLKSQPKVEHKKTAPKKSAEREI